MQADVEAWDVRMILSRTMRPQDYEDFEPELQELDKTIAVVGPVPYTHRRWEYALILRAVKQYFGQRFLRVADFGCETGLSPALMLMHGHDVSLYEIWTWGNKEAEAKDKAEMARLACLVNHPDWATVNRPLGGLTQEDKKRYDVGLCISVMEHIQDEVSAFNDLMDAVKERGMVILTMDFAPVNQDTLYYHWLRARIYNEQRMISLWERAQQKGFQLMDGQADWTWSSDMKMVQNEYGFASIVLVRD